MCGVPTGTESEYDCPQGGKILEYHCLETIDCSAEGAVHPAPACQNGPLALIFALLSILLIDLGLLFLAGMLNNINKMKQLVGGLQNGDSVAVDATVTSHWMNSGHKGRKSYHVQYEFFHEGRRVLAHENVHPNDFDSVVDYVTEFEAVCEKKNPLNCRLKFVAEGEGAQKGYEWWAFFVLCAVPGLGLAVLSFYFGEVQSFCTMGIISSIVWPIGVFGVFPLIPVLTTRLYLVRGVYG
jgi:hypothetical protein